PDDAWKRLKLRVKKPLDFAILQHVAAWREREARERNVPRGRVIKDDAIYEVAQQHPRDSEALGRLRTIPKGWERSGAAAGLLGAVAKAMALPREDLPRLPRPPHAPEGAAAAAELLKVLLKLVADRQGVAPKMLASSDDIDRIAADGADADVPAMSGWRREVFGKEAVKLIEGELALRFNNRKIEVFEPADARSEAAE
ncbi:MAG: HRDC domain-containing protein, partial [Nitratireductor sp.]